MTTQIIRTNVGAEAEQDALIRGDTMPKISRLKIVSGVPVVDPLLIQKIDSIPDDSVTHEVPINSTLISRPEQGIAVIDAYISPEINCKIMALAIFLEDGTIWGYAPYKPNFVSPESGGVLKTSEYGISLKIIISHAETGSLSVSYSPYDTRDLVQIIAAEIREVLSSSLAAPPVELVSHGGIEFPHVEEEEEVEVLDYVPSEFLSAGGLSFGEDPLPSGLIYYASTGGANFSAPQSIGFPVHYLLHGGRGFQ